MIRAVLFDAVDTLIRPWPGVGAVYARAARAHGLRCGPLALERGFRSAYHRLLPERFFGSSGLRTSEPRERGWWRRVAGLSFSRAGCREVAPVVIEEAFEAFARGSAWRPLPGAAALLDALAAAGLRIGVVSNYDARLHRVLAELGLDARCGTVAVSSEVGWAKPSGRIYRRALADLGVGAAEALMVGDRRREDVDGARAVGLRALLLDPSGRSRGGDVVRRLRQVPARLRAMGSALEKRGSGVRP